MAQILLVEPDRQLAQTYASAFSQVGYQIGARANAQTAIQAVDSLSPDLIILEIQLIEHSGIEFLYELRSYPEWQDIPVIILTQIPPAEFNDNLQILRGELNVSSILYKPHTNVKKMLQTVSEIVPVLA